MSEDLILVNIADGIATVTLNRPQAMNALNRALRRQLYAVMRGLDADDAVRAVILTGAGTRAFTAGLDLKELGSEAGALGSANATDPADNPVKAIEVCTKPVIGAINGVAITGGFEVALACDVLIASENARFADTHARVGIMPGWGLSQKLSRMIGMSRAKELAFTGNFLDAATAHAWGLVNHVVPADDLLPLARKLAGDMASIDPAFLGHYKRLIDEGFALSFAEGLALEAARSSAANAAVAPQEVEARRAAVQQRGRSHSQG
jgi:enoyl-CoA hydratase